MKKCFLFAFFLLPFVANAQKEPYTLKSKTIYEGRWSNFYPNMQGKRLYYYGESTYNRRTNSYSSDTETWASHGDTIIADGVRARRYILPHLGEYADPYAPWNYTYWQLPDSIGVIIKKDTEILYPGLLPGLHNFASDEITVDSVSPSGSTVFFRYVDRPPSQVSVYNKPSRTRSCEYGGYSMYAKVKLLGENESSEKCEHAVFKVRIIGAGSKEKADFDVHVVNNNRWGLPCAQWRWVDSDEDFCVRFVNSNESFTIRVFDK
jgi:hypothetical protein